MLCLLKRIKLFLKFNCNYNYITVESFIYHFIIITTA